MQIQAEKTEDKVMACEISILDIKEFLATGDAASLVKTPGSKSADIQNLQDEVKFVREYCNRQMQSKNVLSMNDFGMNILLIGGLNGFDSKS